MRGIASGAALFGPAALRRLVARFAAMPADRPAAPVGTLTAREREVLLLLARGRSNQDIADALVVSEHTVKTHVVHVLAKLGLRDRVQAVILAYEAGLVAPGE